MLTIPTRNSIFTHLIPFLPKNPNSPKPSPTRFVNFHTPKRFACIGLHTPPMSASSSTKLAAEYAKSKRSSCKKCSEPIAAQALRLGLVSRDPKGFDVTKWHHLDCFNFRSDLVASVEKIKGFQSLKSSDQEALKKLVGASHESREEDTNESKYAIEGKQGSHGKRVCEVDENENEIEERSPKKAKSSKFDGQAKLEISLSISDVKDKYKDATLSPKWKAFQTIIFLERDEGLHDSSKIAAFDFDGCLANTNVKRVGPDAWSLMYPSIPDKLQSLYKDGYKLVIFTNESNIERWKNKRQVAVDSKIGRLNNFIGQVRVPIQVFIACGLGKVGKAEDPFRKPKPGMWHILEQHFNSGISIDMDQSFYVGDAAGRQKDHSDADIKFAEVQTYNTTSHACRNLSWVYATVVLTGVQGLSISHHPFIKSFEHCRSPASVNLLKGNINLKKNMLLVLSFTSQRNTLVFEEFFGHRLHPPTAKFSVHVGCQCCRGCLKLDFIFPFLAMLLSVAMN